MVSGSDSSSEGLQYSLCFLFFMGLRSSEVLVLEEFWPEAFSTMTDLREGQPEGKKHPQTHPAPPTRLLSQEQEGGLGPKSKASGKPCPLPLLVQLEAATMGGTRAWTRALLRLTRLALTVDIILWGVLRGIFWRVLGEVRCGDQRGLRPPTPTQPHPGSDHFGALDP